MLVDILVTDRMGGIVFVLYVCVCIMPVGNGNSQLYMYHILAEAQLARIDSVIVG